MSPISAPPEQREEVAAVFRLLDRVSQQPTTHCRIVGPDGEEISIPESMLCLFEWVAEVLARGDAITVLPVGQELTTQQAADLLNVSRQYLVRLLDQGKIACTRTGTHRRIRVQDLLAYKRQRDDERVATLDALTEMSQALGGYDDIPQSAVSGWLPQSPASYSTPTCCFRSACGTRCCALPLPATSNSTGRPRSSTKRAATSSDAAVTAGAQVIVTFNLKDFRALPDGIEAQSPGDFLSHLLDLDPAGMVEVLRAQAAALRRPAKTLDQLLEGLGKTVPAFVEQVRTRLGESR